MSASASGWRADFWTVRVLFKRDLLRFARERSRVLGMVAQPLLVWLLLGTGYASTFRLPDTNSVGYLEYFFPGTVVLAVLFAAVFATMSVIEDRRAGFLQAVLVAPGSRAAVVIGKSFGSTSLAMIQAALLCLLAPAAGFAFGGVAWGLLAVAVFLVALALSSLGFAMAWWLNTTQGYHVVMNVVLFPLWILSGAMFPLPTGTLVARILALNPLVHAVSLSRTAFHGDALPRSLDPPLSVAASLLVLAAFAIATLALAAWVCERKR